MSDATLARLGAAGLGLLIGWYVYYINRYRKGDVQFSDITTLVGIIGGGTITSLYGPDKAALFGAYGIGLAVGFFAYLLLLVVLINRSSAFTFDWFLDGRREEPAGNVSIPDSARRTGSAFDAPVASITLADARTSGASRVIAACEAEWDVYADDCSGFVRAVANKLGLPMQGNADDLVDAMQTPGWARLADGPTAAVKAAEGLLVLAGMKGANQAKPSPHGHIVVVVPGTLAHGKYPVAYWGTLHSVGAKARTLNYAWLPADRDQIVYAARAV